MKLQLLFNLTKRVRHIFKKSVPFQQKWSLPRMHTFFQIRFVGVPNIGLNVFGCIAIYQLDIDLGICYSIFYVTSSLSRVSADGNCLYNAASAAISGDEKLSSTLRALTSAELHLDASFYASHPHFLSLLATEETPGLIGRFLQLSHTFETTDLIIPAKCT